jgi:hypothetical protein
MRAVTRAGLTGVHHAGSDRRWVVADADQKRNHIECCGEPGITIAEHKPEPTATLRKVHHQIPLLLCDPLPTGWGPGRDASAQSAQSTRGRVHPPASGCPPLGS